MSNTQGLEGREPRVEAAAARDCTELFSGTITRYERLCAAQSGVPTGTTMTVMLLIVRLGRRRDLRPSLAQLQDALPLVSVRVRR